MTAALAHLRVLDLCDLRGALAGRMLADLGADVLKVEPPGGERDRLRAPFVADKPAPDRSLAFLFRNANKGSVAIDLADRARPCASRRASRARRRVARKLLARRSRPARFRSGRSTGAPSASPARRDRGLRAHRSARGLDRRADLRVGGVGGALRRRLRRSAALQRARSPRSRLRRDLRGGGGAGGARRPGANRPRANGRGLRAGSRARRYESVVDSARRLRAALSAVAYPHSAQR